MPGDAAEGTILLRRRFPVLRLLESAGLALAPISVLIATLAASLLNGADAILDRVLVPDAKLVVDADAVLSSPIAAQ